MSRAAPKAVRPSYSDDTCPRITAYLNSVRLRSGLAYEAGELDRYIRGRCAIQRLADSARGESAPRARLSIHDCADILNFMKNSEPVREDWYSEPDDAPSHLVGLQFVLEAMEAVARRAGVAKAVQS